jgi:TorA maturation chaperone TorD
MEVNSPETLLAALQQKAKRAAIEVEDATSAVSRAEAERAMTERTIGSMRQYHLRDEHVALVAALIDPEAKALAAAKQRLAAAQVALAAAQKACEMAAAHVQMQQAGAAGAFYQGGGAATVAGAMAAATRG